MRTAVSLLVGLVLMFLTCGVAAKLGDEYVKHHETVCPVTATGVCQ